jgi:3-mercaptopyruvate sulfurtransferase SseA
MRLIISFAAVVVLAAVFLSACNSTEKSTSNSPVAALSPAATVPGDGVRRITAAELKALLDKGQAVVIDVRNEGSYSQGHIRGAKLIPATEILSRLSELPRDKTIVTYCS